MSVVALRQPLAGSNGLPVAVPRPTVPSLPPPAGTPDGAGASPTATATASPTPGPTSAAAGLPVPMPPGPPTRHRDRPANRYARPSPGS